MGIYIKGMEMPKEEELLSINIWPDGKVTINQVATAIPVPPHGRLIDADELCAGRVSNDNVVICVKVAPTIIEAEEGNKNESYN